MEKKAQSNQKKTIMANENPNLNNLKITCKYCKKKFVRHTTNQIYCSIKCRGNRYANSPKGKTRISRWRKQHPNKVKEALKKYTHSKKFRKQQHRYKTSKKGLKTANRNWHTRRLRKLDLIEDYSNKEWLEKLAATKGFCPGCGNYVGIAKLTLDHIIPISKAPKSFVYTIDDVQPLCKSCNCSKRDGINEQ